uniref:Uncharacterized serine-rich protein C215.13-like n=1 Tax=Dermatophagoides pteronyssinus TaxID=6956 RepID=A0A6P6XXZ7_DERPT|nr:uncharacterized serine-rich protein C215.13-like [Dermatophagoides pteronyssinus]
MIRYVLQSSIICLIIFSIQINLLMATVQIQLESMRPSPTSSSSSSSSLSSSSKPLTSVSSSPSSSSSSSSSSLLSSSSSTSNALTSANTILDNHSTEILDPSILYGGVFKTSPTTNSIIHSTLSSSGISSSNNGNINSNLAQSIHRQQQQQHRHLQTPSSSNIPGSSSSTSDYIFQLLPQNENIVSHNYQGSGMNQEELYEENSIMSHRAPIYSTAISSKRSYEVKPMVIENQPVEPSVVNVDGSEQPVKVIFHTQSSPMMVRQVHTPRKPVEVERTNSVDEPHRVVHAVMRPVIQEVREIIQPYRRLTQEIRPVLEEIHTIVSKDERSEQSGSMQHSGMNGSPPAMSYASSNQQIQRSPPQSRYNNRIVDLGANDNGNLMANTQPSNGYRHRDMMVPMHSNNAIKLIRMNRDYGQDYNANNQLYAILNEQFGQQSSTGQTTSNSATNGPPILMASGSSLNYRQQMSPLPSKQISNTSNSVFGDIPIETLFNLKLNRNKKPRTQRF